MANTNHIFTENLNLLIEHSGLTDENFSNMMGFSLRKLKYLKNGKGSLKVDELEKISSFFSMKNINTKKINVEKDLRLKLIKTHAKNEEYITSLREAPTIVYAIKIVLLDEGIFENPIGVKEIKSFFKQRDWNYSSSAISMALTRMPDLIKIEPHPSKKGTFVYSKK
ncbi:MAG: hypothetical protein EOP54_15065 [Sphingobacteriales bacterium]|nr:MAG: hypothetical protein EOP54_15065 [Sphingobacteriales bacterium]